MGRSCSSTVRFCCRLANQCPKSQELWWWLLAGATIVFLSASASLAGVAGLIRSPAGSAPRAGSYLLSQFVSPGPAPRRVDPFVVAASQYVLAFWTQFDHRSPQSKIPPQFPPQRHLCASLSQFSARIRPLFPPLSPYPSSSRNMPFGRFGAWLRSAG